MKRYISIVLILCLLFTSLTVSVTADETTSLPSQEKVKLIYGLDLISLIGYEDFDASRVMTRAELTYLLNTLFEYKNEIEGYDWSFYGDSDEGVNDLKEPQAYGETRFSDVPQSHWAYEEIEKAMVYGLMHGATETTFEPEETVTTEQFVKCIVSIMGYNAQANVYGGYPGGYLRVASELKILKNIDTASGVTYGDVVEILYNCMDVNLYKAGSVSEHTDESHITYMETGETFLSGILGLGRIRGVMTDNSVTSLIGNSQVGENELLIGGVKFKADEAAHTELSEYIGRELDCYYKLPESGTDANNIVYAALSNKDVVTVITSKEYTDYRNNIIYYENSLTENEESIQLSSFYNLIYNGEVKTTFDDTIFNLDNGKITVIERTDSDTNVVVVESWETVVVNAVDTTAGKIYNRLENTNSIIDLEQYDNVKILNEDGSYAVISDVTVGAVLDIKESANTITIKINNHAEKIIVEGVLTGDGKDKVVAAGTEYPIADCYNSYSSKIVIEPGDEVTIYLNGFGEIAWVEQDTSNEFRVGYLIESGTEKKGITVKTGVVMFDTTEKGNKTYYTNEKRVVLSNATGEEVPYKDMTQFLNALGSYSGIVRFKLDTEGYLSYLELPITDTQYIQDGKLSLMPNSSGEMYYRFNNLGGRVIMSTTATSLIAVNPARANSEEGYGVYQHSDILANEQNYELECYTTKKGSRLARYVVYETDAQTSPVVFSPYSDPKVAIVKNVVKAFDETEGVITRIYAYCFGLTAAARDETLSVPENIVPTTTFKHEFNGNLEPGDLITYGLDERGYVNDIRILWDENGVNPASPNGSRGMLTDSKGYYGVGADAPVHNSSGTYTGDMYNVPNPYSLSTSAGNVVATNNDTFRAGPFALFYGFCYNIMDDVIQYTTQDLTVEDFDETGVNGKHQMRIWPKPSGIISVKLSGKDNIDIVGDTNYTANNTLKTAEINGKDCSRIITISAYCQVFKTIVINGSLE